MTEKACYHQRGRARQVPPSRVEEPPLTVRGPTSRKGYLALDIEHHVGPGGLSVRSKVVSHREPDGHWVAEVLPYTKTRRNRVVPWTAPQVRRDVRDHVMVTGVRRGLLFPKAGDPQQPWVKHDWDNWREDVLPARRAGGRHHRPQAL